MNKKMTIEELRDFMLYKNLDLRKIHEMTIFWKQCSDIVIYDDGIIFALSNTETLINNSHVVVCIPTSPFHSIDTGCYLEGWGQWDGETEKFTTDDGRILSEKDAVLESIETGDWTEIYESYFELALEQMKINGNLKN